MSEEAASIDLLKRAYIAFNRRDLDAALATMAPDVNWPNGMEGGTVHGHAGVRDYWTRQWGMIDPHVDPLTFTQESDGRIAIEVHQVIKDLSGKLLMDRTVEHVYTLENDLISSMEIRE